MTSSIQKWRLYIALAMFFGLFFLRPLWSYGQHGLEVLPSLPFGAVFALLIPPYIALAIIRGPLLTWPSALALILFGTIVALTTVQLPGLLSVEPGDAVLLYVQSTIYPAAALIFGLEYADLKRAPEQERLLRRLTKFAFFTYCAVTLGAVIYRYLNVAGASFPAIYQKPGAALTYLAMSTGFLLVGLLYASQQRGRARALAVLVATLLFLVPLHSRFSVGAVLLLIILFVLDSGRKKPAIWLAVILSGCVILPLAILYTPHETLAEWRMTRLIVDPAADSSFAARLALAEQGRESLQQNMLFGVYGYELLYGSGRGSYIHSILSYWQQYGVFVFFAKFLLLFSAFGLVCVRWSRRGLLEADIFPVGVILTAVLGGAFAKSYVWPVTYLAIALAGAWLLVGRRRSSG